MSLLLEPDHSKRLCLLPRIGESIFCDEILSFLSSAEVLSVMQSVLEISRLYRLPFHYCAIHGNRLQPVPNSDKETDKSKKRKQCDDDAIVNETHEWKEQEASHAQVEAYYKYDRRFREWCAKHPVLHPDRCHDCQRAQQGEEYCPVCQTWARWSRLHECMECSHCACETCCRSNANVLGVVGLVPGTALTWKVCHACEGWLCGTCFHNQSGFVCEFCHCSLCGRSGNDDQCCQEQCGECQAFMCSDCVYRGCPHSI